MRFEFLLLLFLIYPRVQAHGYFDFDNRLQETYKDIIALRLEIAEKNLQSEKIEKPGNNLRLLFANYIDFLKAFITEEDSFKNILKNKSAERLDFLNKKSTDKSSPFYLYSISEILLQQAFIKIKSKDYMSAAIDIRKAYKLIEKNKVAFPTFLLNHKLSGFLQAMIGLVPEKFRWLTDLSGMKGSVISGRNELLTLYSAIDKSVYKCFKEEILFYLCIIQSISYGLEEDSRQLLELVHPFAIKNPLMQFSFASLGGNTGQNDKVIAVLSGNENANSFPFYYLSYKKAIAKLRKLDLSAEVELKLYVEKFHGKNYIKSAYQKLAWISLLHGDFPGYRNAMNNCKISGNQLVDEDIEAQKEALSGDLPNLLLLRSRMLFDGGYYKQSLIQVINQPPDSFPRYRDKLELIYRFGRIMQKTDKTEKAIEYFKETLQTGSSSHFYFAANSALMLGNIYEMKRDFELSKFYYDQCLALPEHEYQNSIDQKAKAGLERINRERKR